MLLLMNLSGFYNIDLWGFFFSYNLCVWCTTTTMYHHRTIYEGHRKFDFKIMHEDVNKSQEIG